MWISHRKEIRKLTFRALAICRSESNDEGLTLETSAFEYFHGGHGNATFPALLRNPWDPHKTTQNLEV